MRILKGFVHVFSKIPESSVLELGFYTSQLGESRTYARNV